MINATTHALVQPDAWKSDRAVLLAAIRQAIDAVMPAEVPFDAYGSITWGNMAIDMTDVRAAVGAVAPAVIVQRLFQQGKSGYRGSKGRPPGIGLHPLSGLDRDMLPLWTVAKRSACGSDIELLWTLDQYLRRQEQIIKHLPFARPHVVEGPLYITPLGKAALEMSSQQIDLRSDLSPHNGIANPSAEIYVGNYPHAVDVTLRLRRNLVTATAKHGDQKFEYAGNRFILRDTEMSHAALSASIGRLLREVIEHPLLALDDARITSVRDDDDAGDIIFGIGKSTPILLDDGEEVAVQQRAA